MDAVSEYLNNVLAPTLWKYGVSESFVTYTAKIVAMQMNSLLRHWDDIKFRKTVLLLGIEEGSFYEPPAKLEIRCFVVVTLRNSPIEVIQSDSFARSGLKQPLTNQEVKSITSAAVRFFSQQNFEEMCRQAKSTISRDIYGELHDKYPVTWLSMQTVAMTNTKTVDYPKWNVVSPYVIYGAPLRSIQKDEKPGVVSVVQDGYDPAIDGRTMEVLCKVEAAGDGLIVESFKGLTRNVEKLFQIIEFLLTHEIPFVTANFYLENGHVEKRMKPLRAGHTDKEAKNNLIQTSGVGFRHKRALNRVPKDVDPSFMMR